MKSLILRKLGCCHSTQKSKGLNKASRKSLSPLAMRSPLVQAKLKVGASNDRYEQEADRVANQLMRISETQLQRQSERKILKPEPLTKTISSTISGHPNDNETFQVKHELDQSSTVSLEILRRIQQTQGSGKPLPEKSRIFFEAFLGADLSHIRVHTDTNAAITAQKLNAQAFTIGSDIFFGRGRYTPTSAIGKYLLAHELVHAIQQSSHLSESSLQLKKEKGSLATSGHTLSFKDIRSLSKQVRQLAKILRSNFVIKKFLAKKGRQELAKEIAKIIDKIFRSPRYGIINRKGKIIQRARPTWLQWRKFDTGTFRIPLELYVSNEKSSASGKFSTISSSKNIITLFLQPHINKIRQNQDNNSLKELANPIISTLAHEIFHFLIQMHVYARKFYTRKGFGSLAFLIPTSRVSKLLDLRKFQKSPFKDYVDQIKTQIKKLEIMISLIYPGKSPNLSFIVEHIIEELLTYLVEEDISGTIEYAKEYMAQKEANKGNKSQITFITPYKRLSAKKFLSNYLKRHWLRQYPGIIIYAEKSGILKRINKPLNYLHISIRKAFQKSG